MKESYCGSDRAHKSHPWETKKGKPRECPGMRAHPNTMIGRGEKR